MGREGSPCGHLGEMQFATLGEQHIYEEEKTSQKRSSDRKDNGRVPGPGREKEVPTKSPSSVGLRGEKHT